MASSTISPTDLGNMVKNGQFTQLREYGGVEQLARKLHCLDVNAGLDPSTVDFDQIKRTFGKNELEPPRVPSYLLLVKENLQDVTIILLLAAAIVSLILGSAFEEKKAAGWIEGAAILFAVAFVVNFQAGTDWNNARTFRNQYLELEQAKRVNVIRCGEIQSIHPKDLVVGDILRLEAGSVLPADGVLVEGRALKLDESALTGESKLLDKAPFDINSLLNAENKSSPFMLSGTSVVNGNGRMLVVAVGVHSLQGQILAVVVGQDQKSKDENKNSLRIDETVPLAQIAEKTTSSKGGDVEVQLPSLDPVLFNHDARQSLRYSQFSLRSHRTAVTPSLRNGGGQHSQKFFKKGRYDRVCCGSRKTSDEPNLEEGTLSDKLDKMALKIGKIGALVASVVFIVMCARWSIEQFGEQQGFCPLFNSNLTQCVEVSAVYGCVLSATNTSCNRAWAGADDVSTILRFFITAITILVVVVPEGLPVAVTLSLTLSMRRMARDHNQVKNMDSSETMGSATTICTDKTGTLTENRMTVVRVALLGNELKSSGSTTLGSNLMSSSQINTTVKAKLAEAFALATSASSMVEGKTQRGNATDCALLRLCTDMSFDWKSMRHECKPDMPGMDWGVYVYPFSSSRKRSSIVISLPKGEGFRVYSVGAPNYIMESCVSAADVSGATVSLEGGTREFFETALDNYAHQAMRTIAIGYRDYPSVPAGGWDLPAPGHERTTDEDVVMLFAAEQNLTLLGCVGIEDPLRQGVVEAVQKCYTAGVDVRMCTGDALETAIAISLQCGILRERDMEKGANGRMYPKDCFAMTGAEFDERIHQRDHTKPLVWRRAYDFKTKKFGEMRAPPFTLDANGVKVVNLKRFDQVWPKLRVLARCLPEDKLNLVKGLRRSELFKDTVKCQELEEQFGIKIFPDHQVVAVTGDGTNDAPALKAADVGFAMGIVGTDIAKQACDIILLDDNFASIVTAIKWGRNVFDSISKFVQFQLKINFVAIVIACIGAFAFNRSPLGPVQMLWVNLIMDSFAAFALATDPPGPELLERAPYGKKRSIVSLVMACNIFGQGFFQIVTIVLLLWNPQWIPDENWAQGNIPKFPPSNIDILADVANNQVKDKSQGSIHWTIIFNTFVMMQLVNQFNARKLQTSSRLKTTWHEWNVFEGLHKNPLFIIIFLLELTGQVLIVQFADAAFYVKALNGPQWLFCIAIGMISLPWQFAVNCVFLLLDHLLNKKPADAAQHQQLTAAVADQKENVFRVVAGEGEDKV